jgi:hypothetical protein
MPRGRAVALGSGWYHEEAIREERARKDWLFGSIHLEQKFMGGE